MVVGCAGFYLLATALSLFVAHLLLIAAPHSGLGERLIMPVAKTLEFLDAHWKPVLVLAIPFIHPAAWDILPRIRKIGSVELDPVPLEKIGVREKPPHGGEGAQ